MSLEKFIIDFNSLLKEIKNVLDLKVEPLFNFKDIHVLSSIEISQKSKDGFSLPFKLIENTFILAKDRVFKSENISFLPMHENFIVVPVKAIIQNNPLIEKELFLLFPASFEIEEEHRNSFANCIFEYAFNVFEQSPDIESKVSACNILLSFKDLVPNEALSIMEKEWFDLISDPIRSIEFLTGRKVKSHNARKAFKEMSFENFGAIFLHQGMIIFLSNDKSARKILLAIDKNLEPLEFYPRDLFSINNEWINDLSHPSIQLLRSLEALAGKETINNLRKCDAEIFLPQHLELNFFDLEQLVHEGGLDPYGIKNVEIWDFISEEEHANEDHDRELTHKPLQEKCRLRSLLRLLKSIFS